MPYYDDDATDRAAAGYGRHCDRNGLTGMQPNRHQTEMVGDTIYLRSNDRVLARCRVKPGGSVRRIGGRS